MIEYWLPFLIGGIFLVFFIGLLVFIFWIWMIIDSIQRKYKKENEKFIWILLVIIGGWIGALIYFIIIKKLNPKGVI